MKRDCVFSLGNSISCEVSDGVASAMLYRANACLLVMLSGLEISIWSGQVCNRSFRITVSRKISQALAPKIYDELQLSARNLKPSR